MKTIVVIGTEESLKDWKALYSPKMEYNVSNMYLEDEVARYHLIDRDAFYEDCLRGWIIDAVILLDPLSSDGIVSIIYPAMTQRNLK